ncbi:Uncharacterised protein [Bordetella pertussis]|nr:Uncharacterised protein [Bordetella pertussis]CFU81763.1 Uncharacterised protein [Bordetella pertussis]CPL09370.1 Uncharacterised protein [Bordetella pertussis]CPM60858.1 Uncharacterised protein [Bordetella pertussis]CPN39073.1 Uncharacterised protein [Bordetella pertussis]
MFTSTRSSSTGFCGSIASPLRPISTKGMYGSRLPFIIGVYSNAGVFRSVR